MAGGADETTSEDGDDADNEKYANETSEERKARLEAEKLKRE